MLRKVHFSRCERENMREIRNFAIGKNKRIHNYDCNSSHTIGSAHLTSGCHLSARVADESLIQQLCVLLHIIFQMWMPHWGQHLWYFVTPIAGANGNYFIRVMQTFLTKASENTRMFHIEKSDGK